ncbi:MAG: hypothetical protein WBA46_10065, partial [Thermomicrobiales bacterium]
MVGVALPELQAVIDAAHKVASRVVLINGIATDVVDVTTRHSVKDPIGTCTIEMPAPLPAHVTPGASVAVQMGYAQLTGTVFRGRIPKTRTSISMDGLRATVTAVSNGNRLNRKDYVDTSYPGPITLKDFFQAVCTRRKVEQFFSDETTYVDQQTGNEVTIYYGNNQD